MIAYLILHYKNADVTKQCLDSLLMLEGQEAQIVVVDNASNNGSYEEITEQYGANPRIHLLHNEENLGYAAGNNIGFSYARNTLGAEWIVLLNNDVVVEQKDFLQVMLSEYQKHPFYVAGPDIVTPEGNSQNPYLMNCPDQTAIRKKLFHDYAVWILLKLRLQQLLKRLLHYDGSIFQPNETPTIADFHGVLHGSCLIFSPDFLRSFHGLYPETFLYCEEEILCYILNRLGYPYSYLKSLKVIHRHSVSMKREIHDETKRKMTELRRRIDSYKKFLKITKEKNDPGKFLQ